MHSKKIHNNNLIKKCADNLNRHCPKEDKYVKRCSISLITREMQIKTQLVSEICG